MIRISVSREKGTKSKYQISKEMSKDISNINNNNFKSFNVYSPQ